MDVVIIFIPAILIIFGIILFILGAKKTDVHIEQEAVTQQIDTKDDSMKMLDSKPTENSRYSKENLRNNGLKATYKR